MKSEWLDSVEDRKEKINKKIIELFFSVDDIFNPSIAEEGHCIIFDFISKALAQAPDYFWLRASSTSGKHHPPDEFCVGGLSLHIYKCLILASEIIRGIENHDWVENWVESSDFSMSIIDRQKTFVGAIALHDLYASGMPNQEYYQDNGTLATDPLHMLYVRQMCENIELSYCLKYRLDNVLAKTQPFFDPMMKMIEGHYGAWSPLPQVKPIDKFSQLVYLIDYIVSRRCVQIETL